MDAAPVPMECGVVDYRFESRYARYDMAKSQHVQARTELLVATRSARVVIFPRGAVTQSDVEG